MALPNGEPLQDIYQMAGVVDRYRRFVVDEQPVVTGLVAVGDSWACTNPQGGRGISTGLRQAIALRNVVRESADEPVETVMAFDRVTEETCTPWYRLQVARDHARHAQVQAAIAGHAVSALDDPLAKAQADFGVAAAFDPDIARALLEVFSCLTLPSELLQRPALAERVRALAAEHEMPQVPGPTREELLEVLR